MLRVPTGVIAAKRTTLVVPTAAYADLPSPRLAPRPAQDVDGWKSAAIGMGASVPRLLAAVVALAGLVALGTLPARAQGAVKGKYGDWEMRCETPNGAPHEQCALIQRIEDKDRPNVNLVVIVLRTADAKNRLLRVVAPLGVLLPSGLGLKIDDANVGRAGFVRCLPTGCVAEVSMKYDLIDQLRNGTAATFIIFQTPEEGIGIPLTLTGFKDGFDKLPCADGTPPVLRPKGPQIPMCAGEVDEPDDPSQAVKK